MLKLEIASCRAPCAWLFLAFYIVKGTTHRILFMSPQRADTHYLVIYSEFRLLRGSGEWATVSSWNY